MMGFVLCMHSGVSRLPTYSIDLTAFRRQGARGVQVYPCLQVLADMGTDGEDGASTTKASDRALDIQVIKTSRPFIPCKILSTILLWMTE